MPIDNSLYTGNIGLDNADVTPAAPKPTIGQEVKNVANTAVSDAKAVGSDVVTVAKDVGGFAKNLIEGFAHQVADVPNDVVMTVKSSMDSDKQQAYTDMVNKQVSAAAKLPTAQQRKIALAQIPTNPNYISSTDQKYLGDSTRASIDTESFGNRFVSNLGEGVGFAVAVTSIPGVTEGVLEAGGELTGAALRGIGVNVSENTAKTAADVALQSVSKEVAEDGVTTTVRHAAPSALKDTVSTVFKKAATAGIVNAVATAAGQAKAIKDSVDEKSPQKTIDSLQQVGMSFLIGGVTELGLSNVGNLSDYMEAAFGRKYSDDTVNAVNQYSNVAQKIILGAHIADTNERIDTAYSAAKDDYVTALRSKADLAKEQSQVDSFKSYRESNTDVHNNAQQQAAASADKFNITYKSVDPNVDPNVRGGTKQTKNGYTVRYLAGDWEAYTHEMGHVALNEATKNGFPESFFEAELKNYPDSADPRENTTSEKFARVSSQIQSPDSNTNSKLFPRVAAAYEAAHGVINDPPVAESAQAIIKDKAGKDAESVLATIEQLATKKGIDPVTGKQTQVYDPKLKDTLLVETADAYTKGKGSSVKTMVEQTTEIANIRNAIKEQKPAIYDALMAKMKDVGDGATPLDVLNELKGTKAENYNDGALKQIGMDPLGDYSGKIAPVQTDQDSGVAPVQSPPDQQPPQQPTSPQETPSAGQNPPVQNAAPDIPSKPLATVPSDPASTETPTKSPASAPLANNAPPSREGFTGEQVPTQQVGVRTTDERSQEALNAVKETIPSTHTKMTTEMREELASKIAPSLNDITNMPEGTVLNAEQVTAAHQTLANETKVLADLSNDTTSEGKTAYTALFEKIKQGYAAVSGVSTELGRAFQSLSAKTSPEEFLKIADYMKGESTQDLDESEKTTDLYNLTKNKAFSLSEFLDKKTNPIAKLWRFAVMNNPASLIGAGAKNLAYGAFRAAGAIMYRPFDTPQIIGDITRGITEGLSFNRNISDIADEANADPNSLIKNDLKSQLRGVKGDGSFKSLQRVHDGIAAAGGFEKTEDSANYWKDAYKQVTGKEYKQSGFNKLMSHTYDAFKFIDKTTGSVAANVGSGEEIREKTGTTTLGKLRGTTQNELSDDEKNDIKSKQFEKAVMMNPPEGFSGKLSQAMKTVTDAFPPLKPFAFFLQRASNRFDIAMDATPIVNVAKAGMENIFGGREWTSAQKGAALVGATVSGYALYQVFNGKGDFVTGAGPSGKNKQASWLRTHQPYSISLDGGNTWIPYKNAPSPLVPILEASGTMADEHFYGSKNQKESTVADLVDGVGKLGNQLISQSQLSELQSWANFLNPATSAKSREKFLTDEGIYLTPGAEAVKQGVNEYDAATGKPAQIQ